MTQVNFFEILKDAVKNSTASDYYQQLNTFAVISSEHDLSTENLGLSADYINTPYFYSRKQERVGNVVLFDFPALIAVPSIVQKRFTFTKQRETCYSINLGVVYPKNTTSCNNCPPLKKWEIYDLTERLLNYITLYLYDVKAYDNGSEIIYLNTKHLAELQDAGQYLTVTENINLTQYFKKSLTQNNGSLELSYYEDVTIHSLYGFEVEVKFCKCDNNDYSLTLTNEALCC